MIRNFREYHDVVVSVARKTDGRHWADLFSAAGRSTEYMFSLLLYSAIMINDICNSNRDGKPVSVSTLVRGGRHGYIKVSIASYYVWKSLLFMSTWKKGKK